MAVKPDATWIEAFQLDCFEFVPDILAEPEGRNVGRYVNGTHALASGLPMV